MLKFIKKYKNLSINKKNQKLITTEKYKLTFSQETTPCNLRWLIIFYILRKTLYYVAKHEE